MRPPWESLPLALRDALEEVLGFPVVRAESQRGGFSPGVAARVFGPAGERAFVKAVSAEANPETPDMHRREARFTALLPPDSPSPRLLGVVDQDPWVALALEQVEGHEPGRPWTADDLAACVSALDAQAVVPAHASLPAVADALGEELTGWRLLQRDPQRLDPWQERHLDALADLESRWEQAATGDRWLHLDTRGDNMLVRRDGSAVLVDWPFSAAGNPAFDALAFVPAAVRDGAMGSAEPGAACEELFSRFAASSAASDDAVTAMLAAFTGLMEHRWRQPPPPGLPTVREFQRSQGAVAQAWLRLRTGFC